MKLNLPNKITISRIVMTIFIIIILLFPFENMGIKTMKFFVNESLVVDIKYIIAGVLFIIASLTDFVDGYIARKYNLVTDFGKMVDAIADKMLVNSVLIILAATGSISAIIPVVIVTRGKVVAAIKSGKYKTAFLMTGIALTLFYNLPFELFNLKIAEALLLVATVLSIVSAVQYYNLNKKIIFGD